MRNNKLKIASLIFCIFLITMFFLNIVVSSDSHLLQHGDVEHCQKCAIIHNAQSFLKNLAIIGISILAISLIYPKIIKLKLNTKDLLLNTLVGFKVQFNE